MSTSAESIIATARTDEDWWNEELQSSTIIVATIHSYDNLLWRFLLAVTPSLLEDIVNEEEDDDDFSANNEVAASASIDAVHSSLSLSQQEAGRVAKRDAISLLLVTTSLNCCPLVGIALWSHMILSGTTGGGLLSYSFFVRRSRAPDRDGLAARFKLFLYISRQVNQLR